ELASWGPAGWNNYRVSAQGRGGLDAPNLTVSLGALLSSCPAKLSLAAVVTNQGTAGVDAGIDVDFYAGTPPSGTLLGSVATTKALLPGGSETVTLDVPAPATPSPYYATVDPKDLVPECVENDNVSQLAGGSCSPVVH